MNDLTILVNSCDKYADAWEPFFFFFNLYGGPLKSFPVVLAAETKQYNNKYFNVKTIHFPLHKQFGFQLLHIVNQINTEYVFLLLDDFFLLSPVCEDSFKSIWQFALLNKDVGYLRLPRKQSITEEKEGDFFNVDLDRERLYIGTATLWRRDYLLRILREHESIWDFERYSVIRARQYPERIMRYNSKHPPIYCFAHPSSLDNGGRLVGEGYGIVRGKWLPSNKALFEKYGLNVNFDNPGWYKEGVKPQKTFWEAIIESYAQKKGLIGKICRRIAKFKRNIDKKRKEKLIKLSSY